MKYYYTATANIVPSSPIPVTLMMDAICPSESSVLTRATQRNIPEDGTLQFKIAFIYKFRQTKFSECLLLNIFYEYQAMFFVQSVRNKQYKGVVSVYIDRHNAFVYNLCQHKQI
jgi:hypothetical protein